jgi:hypothetical protein
VAVAQPDEHLTAASDELAHASTEALEHPGHRQRQQLERATGAEREGPAVHALVEMGVAASGVVAVEQPDGALADQPPHLRARGS